MARTKVLTGSGEIRCRKRDHSRTSSHRCSMSKRGTIKTLLPLQRSSERTQAKEVRRVVVALEGLSRGAAHPELCSPHVVLSL